MRYQYNYYLKFYETYTKIEKKSIDQNLFSISIISKKKQIKIH